MDKKDFIEANQYELFGLKFLFFAGKNPKNLFVSFGSMGGGDSYSRWSWFWNNGDYQDAYLFLLDRNDTYFLGSVGNSLVNNYTNSIHWALKESNLSTDNLVMIGNSMGGYGALYYGFTLNAQFIFVGNPQVSKEAAKSGSKTWINCMNSADNFIPIKDLYVKSKKNTRVWVDVGNHTPDIIAAREMKDFFSDQSKIIVNMYSQYPHLFDLPKKNTIRDFSIINNFDKKSTYNALAMGSFISFNTLVELKKQFSINIIANSKFSRVDLLLDYYFTLNKNYLIFLEEIQAVSNLSKESIQWLEIQLGFFRALEGVMNNPEIVDIIVLDNYIELTQKLSEENDKKVFLSSKDNIFPREYDYISIEDIKEYYNNFLIFLTNKFHNAKIFLINVPLEKHRDVEISARSTLFNNSFVNDKVFVIYSIEELNELDVSGAFDFSKNYFLNSLLIKQKMLN